MLPAEALAYRVVRGEVVPRYLDAADEPWVRDLIDVWSAADGLPLREARSRLREPPARSPPDKARMVVHVLSAAFEVRPPSVRPEPRALREALFGAAAEARRIGGRTREQVVGEVAGAFGLAPDRLLELLLADLPAERPVAASAAPDPRELALRVNLALVQGLLKRALAVRITLLGNARDIVRHVRLQGLLCVARRVDDGVLLELSGPLALFRRTTLYGRAQASVVPRLPWCDRFALEADVVLGGEVRRLRLRPGDPVFPSAPPRRFDSALEQRFVQDLQRRFPDWVAIREPEPLDADGVLVFPDFALARRERPEVRWLVEIAGFWTPEYLGAKLERLRRAGVGGMVLCVDERRNCAALADLPTGMPVVPFRRRVDPAAVLGAVARIEAGPAAVPVPRRIERVPLFPRAYFLDWAGRRPADDPVHARLAALEVGDPLALRPEGGGLFLVDRDGHPVAALSAAARRAWEPRLADVVEARVREKRLRCRSECGAAWRDKLRVGRWWVPLVELHVRR